MDSRGPCGTRTHYYCNLFVFRTDAASQGSRRLVLMVPSDSDITCGVAYGGGQCGMGWAPNPATAVIDAACDSLREGVCTREACCIRGQSDPHFLFVCFSSLPPPPCLPHCPPCSCRVAMLVADMDLLPPPLPAESPCLLLIWICSFGLPPPLPSLFLQSRHACC